MRIPIALSLLVLTTACYAAPRVKVLKLAVTNSTGQARAAENIVVRVSDLKRLAPDFAAGNVIVTTSDAFSLKGRPARMARPLHRKAVTTTPSKAP